MGAVNQSDNIQKSCEIWFKQTVADNLTTPLPQRAEVELNLVVGCLPIPKNAKRTRRWLKENEIPYEIASEILRCKFEPFWLHEDKICLDIQRELCELLIVLVRLRHLAKTLMLELEVTLLLKPEWLYPPYFPTFFIDAFPKWLKVYSPDYLMSEAAREEHEKIKIDYDPLDPENWLLLAGIDVENQRDNT